MKNTMATFKWLTVLTAVFTPFFMVGFALLVIPESMQAVRNSSGVDWLWLILLGAMMLGIYYLFPVYLVDKENINQEFQRLDFDRDGFISRTDITAWPNLIRSFDKFDTDHDGRLSRADFEAYEHAVPAHP